jgi:hypothetical protein
VKAQQRVGYAATGLAAVLMIWGCLSLYAFAKAPQGPLMLSGSGAAAAPAANPKMAAIEK